MSKPKNRTFFAAINADDFVRVTQLIASGADLSALQGPARLPPALYAAVHGHAQSLRALLAAGAAVDEADSFGNTALMLASGHGRVECVRALVEAGANLGKPDDRGIAPIHFAAYKGEHACLQALVASGADVDQVDKEGSSACIFAGRSGQAGSLRLLIAAGADLAKADRQGKTAADHALERGHAACAEAIRARELARDERAALASATTASTFTPPATIAGIVVGPSKPSRSRSL